MSNIQVFKKNSHEWQILDAAAHLMTLYSPTHLEYYAGDVFFDFGQDWMWSTIICKGDPEWKIEYQALYPAQQARLLNATGPVDIAQFVNEYFTESRLDNVSMAG